MSFAKNMGNRKNTLKNSISNVKTIYQDISNNANYWGENGSNIYYNSGNVGIGNNNPKTTLDVTGNLNISGNLNTTTINNLTIGHGGGNNSSNTAIGYNSLKQNSPTPLTGINNVATGYNSLGSNTSGSYNAAFGHSALALNIGGSNNVASGYKSGYNNSGSYNTFIGSFADSTSSSITNSTAIGYNAKVTGSHQIMLGTSSENVVIPSYIEFSDGSKQYTALNTNNDNGSSYNFLQNNTNTSLVSVKAINNNQPENNEINYSNITIDSTNNSINIPGKISIGKHLELGKLESKPTTITEDYNSLWVNKTDGKLYFNDKNMEYAKEWIDQNLLGPPPQIQYGEVKKNSTSIYIPWTFPQQHTLSFLDVKVPFINSLYVSYSGVNENYQLLNGIIMNNITQQQFTSNYNNNIEDVIGVVLIKKTPCYVGNQLVESGNIYDLVFPQDNNTNSTINGPTRKAFVYYNSNLNNLIQTDQNKIIIYYSNFSGNLNNQINFNIFDISYPPSQPQFSYYSNTKESITCNIIQPTFGDYQNDKDKVKIENYKINTSFISNNIKYGQIIEQNLEKIVEYESVTNNRVIIDQLYPDTTYSITASAKNIYHNSYGSSSTFSQITQKLEPIITNIQNDLSLNGIFKIAKRVKDGLIVNNLIANNGSNIVETFPLRFPINEENNRGRLNNNAGDILAKINVTIINGESITGTSLQFTGFPITQVNTINDKGISLIPGSVFDSYQTFNNNSLTGYYLESSVIVRLDNSILKPYSDKYILYINRQNKTSNITDEKTMEYYTDTCLYIPNIESIIITDMKTRLDTQHYKYVSGIYVLDTNMNSYTPFKILVNNINNIGTYFYSTNFLKYTCANSDIENIEYDLSNVVNNGTINSGYTNGNTTISDKITIENPNIQFLFKNYSENIVISAISSNILGQTYSINSQPLNAIVDGKSINLIYNVFKQSIQSAFASCSEFFTGIRVWSGNIDNVTNLPPLLHDNNPNNPYISYPYSNEWDITKTDTITNNGVINTSNELQIADGTFITKSANIGYLNYNGYYYRSFTSTQNDKDYSTIPATGYRSAMFAWRFLQPPGSPKIKLYSSLLVNINKINSNLFLNQNNILFAKDSNGNLHNVLFYYRFEDSSMRQIGNPSLSSNWIDGNNRKNSIVTSSNCNNPQIYPFCGILYPTIIVGNIVTFNLIIPKPITILDYSRYILYILIRLPQESDCRFETITVKLQ